MSAVSIPRRVMVGTDGSETAEGAVRWAAGFADQFGADLYLVRVLGPELGQAARSAAAQTDDLVHHARSIAGNRGHGRIIVDEDPAMAIVRAAEEDGIDVLVVGNVGMAGRKEFLLGNVPNRISHNARCTVIIVNTLGAHQKAGTRTPHTDGGDPDQEAESHRFARATKIAAVFAKHGIRELFGYRHQDNTDGRRRQARRLRAALEELGPTFAKLGQILSTRPDLLPPEFIEELAQLRDHVTPLSEQQVVRVMEEDLAVPWEDVFETIERVPLAAGSIAQVHRATLASGERVVIKVQRPEAAELIAQDLALLKWFAEKAGTRPGVRQFIDVRALFEHLSTSINRELDFRLEAQNADRMRAALSDFHRLAVPGIFADFCTSRLLVMQDVGGVSLADVPAGKVRKETAREFLESFCQQILFDGFFHADPHPGNLMWQQAEERLYFLDLGSVGEVGTEMRELMILLLTAFWQRDAAFLGDVILMLSGTAAGGDRDLDAFRRQIQELLGRYRGSSAKNIQFGPVLHELIELSYRHGVPLPASLTLTAKTLAQMQQVASELDPEIDLFNIAGRFLMRATLRKVVVQGDAKTLFYQSQKFKVRALRAFEALERLIGARPGQKLEVHFRAESLEQAVHSAARRLALGLITGFAVLASALTATSETRANWLAPVFALVGIICAVVLLFDLLHPSKAIRKAGHQSQSGESHG